MPFHYDSPGLENIDQVNDLLAKSPTYQAALRGDWRSPDLPEYVDVNSRGYREQNLRAAAKADGYNIPGGVIDAKTGKVSDPNRERWYSSPAFWGAVAVGASAGAGAIAGAGGAGSGGGAAAAGGGGATTAGSAAGGGAATAGGGAAAGGSGAAVGGGATAAGSGSLLHSLLPTLIGAGTDIAGTVIKAKAEAKAAADQKAADEKALAIQQQQYQLQREDTAPYRSLGLGAVGNLGYLAGIDVNSRVPELSSTQPKYAPAPLPTKPTYQTGNLGSLAAPTPASNSGSTVKIKAPNGLVYLVPSERAQEAQQQGGQLV